jgi:SNF2 family DNA or RNA helicase
MPGFFLRGHQIYSSGDESESDSHDRDEIDTETYVSQLTNMGFPTEEAERAVAIFADDLTAATEWLVRKQSLGSMPVRFVRDYEFNYTFYGSTVQFNDRNYKIRDYDKRFQIVLIVDNHNNAPNRLMDSQWVSLSEPMMTWLEETHDEKPDTEIKPADNFYHMIGRIYLPKHEGFTVSDHYKEEDNQWEIRTGIERNLPSVAPWVGLQTQYNTEKAKIGLRGRRLFDKTAIGPTRMRILYSNTDDDTWNDFGSRGWGLYNEYSSYPMGKARYSKIPDLTCLWACIFDSASPFCNGSKIKPKSPGQPSTVSEWSIRHERCKAYTKMKLIVEILGISQEEFAFPSILNDVQSTKRKINKLNISDEYKQELHHLYQWYKHTRSQMIVRNRNWVDSILPACRYKYVGSKEDQGSEVGVCYEVYVHNTIFNAVLTSEYNSSYTKNVYPFKMIFDAVEMGEELWEDPVKCLSKKYNNQPYQEDPILSMMSVPELGSMILDQAKRENFDYRYVGDKDDMYPHQKELFSWMLQHELHSMSETFPIPYGWTKHTCESGYVYWKHDFGKVLSDPKFQGLRNMIACAGGGIVAQAVGSGKTKTILRLIEYVKTISPKHSTNRTLVVVPTTMLSTWEKECAKWTPDLILCTYYGNRRKIDERADIILTTYRTVSTECAIDSPAVKHVGLNYTRFRRVVLDEGHHVRDQSSKIFDAIQHIEMTRFATKWVITATPFVKNLFDMSAYLHWLDEFACHHLFRCDQPSVYLNHLLSWMESLKRLRQPFNDMIRNRLFYQDKKMVADMSNLKPPTINDTVEVIPTTPEHKELLQCLEERIKYSLENNPMAHTMRLRYVNWLRLAAYNPSRIPYAVYGKSLTNVSSSGARVVSSTAENLTLEGTTKNYVDNLKDILINLNEQKCPICLDSIERPTVTSCGHLFCGECINNSFNSSQGKKCPLCRCNLHNQVLREIKVKEEVENGNSDGVIVVHHDTLGSSELKRSVYDSIEKHKDIVPEKIKHLLKWFETNDGKCLIFTSLSTKITNDIHEKLGQHGIGHVIVSGNMTKRQRGVAIEKFQTDDNCRAFLLTARSASYGLTLTAASTVIFFEPCMNRALRKQCIGRMDRLGQKMKQLNVITYTTEGTVETKLESVLKTRNWAFRDLGL